MGFICVVVKHLSLFSLFWRRLLILVPVKQRCSLSEAEDHKYVVEAECDAAQRGAEPSEKLSSWFY